MSRRDNKKVNAQNENKVANLDSELDAMRSQDMMKLKKADLIFLLKKQQVIVLDSEAVDEPKTSKYTENEDDKGKKKSSESEHESTGEENTKKSNKKAPSKNTPNKKAPESESESEVEVKKTKKKAAKKSKKKASSESDSSEEEPKKKKAKKPEKEPKKPTAKKAPIVEEMVDAIMVEYNIDSENHPFHYLHKQFTSVPLENAGIEKAQVELGKSITFMLSVEGEHLLVDANITSKHVFSVPQNKAGKFVVGKSDMTKNFQSRDQNLPCSSTNSDLVEIIKSVLSNANSNEKKEETKKTEEELENKIPPATST